MIVIVRWINYAVVSTYRWARRDPRDFLVKAGIVVGLLVLLELASATHII